MASVTYRNRDGSAPSIVWRGIRFEDGKAVNIKDVAMLAKARGNPFFEVKLSKEEEDRAAERQRSRTAEGQIVTAISGPTTGYFETGGGKQALEDEDDAEALAAVGPGDPMPAGPQSAGGTILQAVAPVMVPGDTDRRLKDMYGTTNPLDSQEPGEPPAPSLAKVQPPAPGEGEGEKEPAPAPRAAPRRVPTPAKRSR